MERACVPVVADEAMTAALVGTLVELARCAPHFPAAQETPVDAALRVRPRISLLGDAALQSESGGGVVAERGD